MAGSKLVHNNVLDAALQYLEDNVGWISVCESTCTTYEHATATKGSGAGKVLAYSTTPTFTGPADGDSSGRKTTVDQEASMSIIASGTAEEVCLVKTTATTAFLYKTSATSQALTSGGTVTTPAWDIEIADPT